MAVTYYFKSKHDGIVSCQVEMDAGADVVSLYAAFDGRREEEPTCGDGTSGHARRRSSSAGAAVLGRYQPGGPSWYHR